MMKHTFKRALLISSLLVFSSLISTGCFDMNYPSTQEYYDLFNDRVILFYANDDGTSSSRTLKSIKEEIFNDDSVNDVHKVETIDEEYYEYLIIQPTAAVTVQDFAVFVKALETKKFEVKIYLQKEEPDPSKIRSFGLEDKDSDGHDISYDDDYSDPINSTEITAKENAWQSVYVNSWDLGGNDKKYVDVTISDFIVVQFLNNTGYGVDLGYEPVKFSIVNLMVSPKNEKYAVDDTD